jgi:hypothetical protein
MRRLALRSGYPHHAPVDDPEATQLILETLFDIKIEVHDIHVAIFGEDDGEETEADF